MSISKAGRASFPLTCFLMCALSASLCYAGVHGLRFLADEARTEDLLAAADDDPASRKTKLEQAAALQEPWLNQLGYGSRARRLTHLVAEKEGGPQFRIETARAMLMRAPLDGQTWLDLAEASEQASRGAPPPESFAYWNLSQVAAPWEAAVMYGRARFVLRLWPYASPEMRRKAVEHLARFAPHFSARDIQTLKALCADLSAADKAEIGAQLAAVSQNGVGLARQLGLPA